MRTSSPRNALAFLGDKLQVHDRQRQRRCALTARPPSKSNAVAVARRLGVMQPSLRTTGSKSMQLCEGRIPTSPRMTLRFSPNSRKSHPLSSITTKVLASEVHSLLRLRCPVRTAMLYTAVCLLAARSYLHEVNLKRLGCICSSCTTHLSIPPQSMAAAAIPRADAKVKCESRCLWHCIYTSSCL